MINKTIELTGEYPSDFKPTTNVMEIQKFFRAFGLEDARMLGGAKYIYQNDHPEDLIVFNANVIMKDVGKVWYGDLNLTEDYNVLREIAQSLNTELYVLWESHGRFGEENKPINELIKKAVWNTSEDNPTMEWYRNKMKKERGSK